MGTDYRVRDAAVRFAFAVLATGFVGCATGTTEDTDGAIGPLEDSGMTMDTSLPDTTFPEEMFPTGDTSMGMDTMTTPDVPMAGCDAGDVMCSGICTDLQTDPDNCGKCTNVCSGTCSNGHCCAIGQAYCGSGDAGACIDTTTDNSNCGSCGMACTAPTGTCCSSMCSNTATDPMNCGSCGMSCGGGTCSGTPPACMTVCTIPQGSCPHSLCTTGAALPEDCDEDLCTFSVCDPCSLFGGVDPSCCTTSWDATCVSDAEAIEAMGLCGF